ncbi:hypothetical protein H2201_005662 [Coniosporium apollinis]|uniref:Rab-GAP TBC domain-containing protein n=1 Tax=Coniosporium apollinis TaxID=61459 RepID=A0ABQ9NVX6_9PEZI|nr:hypothetical protein H2201_005662 [Coniosporium apollinis]
MMTSNSAESAILFGKPHIYSIDITEGQLHDVCDPDYHVYLEEFFVNDSKDKACGKHLPLTRTAHIETPISPPQTPPRSRAPRVRPLLNTTTLPRIDTMLDTAPDSPPDLTNSKSSKSSSFHSSSLDDVTGFNGVPDFEDISLDELRILPSQSSPKRPLARTSITSTSSSRSSGQGLSSFRDLTNSKPRYPSLRAQVNGAIRQQACLDPPNRTMRRGSTSPSRPALGMRSAPAPRSRSNSPSNPSQHKLPPSPCSLRSNSRSGSSPIGMPLGRRQSWQPGRKTVKELEDEYHDSDEEVPEDAIMWNVPVSPRPPNERSTPQTPALQSPRMSSSRESVQGTVKHHRSVPGVLPTNARSTSGPAHLPPRPPLPVSASESAVTDVHHPYRPRNKSWTAAVYDLSPEARSLTEALEAYAEQTERQHEERVQNGNPATRQSHDKPRTTPSIIELPPLQKGNIMIDPLPISKEKAAVLTRTRPSWLPPKDPKEEAKHLREYQRMMAHSLETEKRHKAKLVEAKTARDETATALSRIWDQHVLPNWTAVLHEPRTRELWWRGIAPRSRGVVWRRAIGNELGLTSASYTAALGRARVMGEQVAGMTEEERHSRCEGRWFADIEHDAATTFPSLSVFQPTGPLYQPLLDLLKAYAMYNPDIGYVHGTHLVAALLLLNLPPGAPTFVALANLLNRAVPAAFLGRDEAAKRRVYSMLHRMLAYKLPRLSRHLFGLEGGSEGRGKEEGGGIGLQLHEWLDPLLSGLFCAELGLEITSRVWDVYVFEGDRALVRAVVGVLTCLEGRLYGSKEEVLEVLRVGEGETWRVGSADEFMAGMRSAGKVEVEGGR